MRSYLIHDKKYIEDLLSSTEEPMVCDLENSFDAIKVLPTSTASAGNQFIVTDTQGKNAFLKYYISRRKATKKSPQVFIKFLPDIDPTVENRMYIEPAIYRHLKTQLVDQNVTPHIMKFIASVHCTNLEQVLDLVVQTRKTNKADDSDPEDILTTWGKLVSGSPINVYTAIKNGAKAVMLFLELGDGMTFDQLCRKRIFNPSKDLKPLLFQVGYTLKQMHAIGIRHNDLHFGNVWIDILPFEEVFQYDLGNGQYAQIKTKYVPKIYDFDLSTFTPSKNRPVPPELVNKAIDSSDGYCTMFGMCSEADPLYDWLTFCYYATTAMTFLDQRDQKIGGKILDALEIDKPFLKSDGSNSIFGGRYCKKISWDKCDPKGIVPKDVIVSFDQLVKNGFFPFVRPGKPPKAAHGIAVHYTYTSLA